MMGKSFFPEWRCLLSRFRALFLCGEDNFEAEIKVIDHKWSPVVKSINPMDISINCEQHVEFDSKTNYDRIDIKPFTQDIEPPFVSSIASHGIQLVACLSGGQVICSADEGLTWSSALPLKEGDRMNSKRETLLSCYTTKGTLLIVGVISSENREYLAVWRKECGDKGFMRTLLCEKEIGPPASISVGKLGVCFTQYLTRNIFYSRDDGNSWSQCVIPSKGVFKDHVHCVWLHPSMDLAYVSGGDAGPKIGQRATSKWDGLGGVIRSADFKSWVRVFTEYPGERIVPLTGNQRRRFFGIEAANGGALATYDDKTYEVIFGRCSLGFINFDTLITTIEGYLIAGTYQYRNITNGGFGHGGEILISVDDGASFHRIRTGFSIVSALATTSRYLFAGFGYGGVGHELDAGTHILRYPIQTLTVCYPKENQVTKIVFNKTDQTLFRTLGVGESTYVANMAPYSAIAVLVIAENECVLDVEAHAYEFDNCYTRDLERWIQVAHLEFSGSGKQIHKLEFPKSGFRIYRVRNAGKFPAQINQVAFIGTIK